MSQSILYIVSTPIGNLSDFSSHAQNILSSVSLILCEDTRHTSKLLHHFGIKNHLESLHLHNEKDKIDYLLDKISQTSTKSAALVSDAGTPAICDPGSFLVAAAHDRGFQITIVPGPSSFPSAVAASGFVQPRTLFSGFLSKNRAEQRAEFQIWLFASPCLAVFFESPKRLLKSLQNIKEFLIENGYKEEEIFVCISREISKKFEEHKRANITEAITHYENREEILGELVICVNLNKVENKETKKSLEELAQISVQKSQSEDIPLKLACKKTSETFQVNSKDIYAIACRLKAND